MPTTVDEIVQAAKDYIAASRNRTDVDGAFDMLRWSLVLQSFAQDEESESVDPRLLAARAVVELGTALADERREISRHHRDFQNVAQLVETMAELLCEIDTYGAKLTNVAREIRNLVG